MEAIRRITPQAQLVQTEDMGQIFSTPFLSYEADFENARLYYANWDAQLMEVGGFPDVAGLSEDDMVARLMLGSQGWPGLGAKLFHVTSKLAIAEGAPAIRLEHFFM